MQGANVQATDRPVLMFGRLPRQVAEAMARVAQSASMALETVATLAEAKHWLESQDPLVLLLDMHAPHAEEVSLLVRGNPRLSLVPVIGLTDAVDDLTFAELYGWGGDDLVTQTRPGGVERRLRALPHDLPAAAPHVRGTAVIGDADHKRRVLLARVLRNAGFDLRFAVEAGELVDVACRDDVMLAIVDVDLEPGGAVEALRRARAKGCKPPWVIAATPKKLGVTMLAAEGLGVMQVYDSFAPLENVLFVANEALRGSFAENRSSPRLLYGTTVAFRIAGRDRDEHGYVYNVSAEGLYVRTMAPLPSGEEAWLELQPPRTDRRVRLEGRVVWQRAFGPVQGATAPPGFGLRITGGSEADLRRYREGYAAFAKDLAAIRTSSHPAGPLSSARRPGKGA
jgi:DNA-binding response OmpR family regulator/Tfp pilus assembly protein PilZ